jgi:diguanylate cyclase (GGDEF)-like protein
MSALSLKHDRPTIGVLSGLSTLEGPIPDPYRISIIQGIQLAARNRQCHLLLSWGIRGTLRFNGIDGIIPSWPELSPETDFIPVGPWNTDGLIVFSPTVNQKQSTYLQQLISQGFPVLFIATGEKGPKIAVNNLLGIQQAVGHLAEHGHRRIAFLAGQPSDKGDSKIRLQSYRSSVKLYKLDDDPGLIIWGWHNALQGYHAMKELLQSGVKFTAIVASNDISAIGAMRAIAEAGLRIPDDIAIIGFDDQPSALAQVPPLSTVHVPLNLIGEQALNHMVDYLQGYVPLKSIQISPRLVKRQSCGCMPEMMSRTTIGTSTDKSIHSNKKLDIQDVLQQLVDKMLNALTSKLTFSNLNIIKQTCNILVESFYMSLKLETPTHFQAVLTKSIHELEIKDADMDYWQEMVSILRIEMLLLPLPWRQNSIRVLAEDMLHQARMIVAESQQRQNHRHQYQRNSEERILNSLVTKLSAGLSEQQVFDVLNLNLNEVGIGHAKIMFFEPEGDDPIAWSVVLDNEKNSQRFLSRQFPPEGLYPPNDLLNIILLPMVYQNDLLGYTAFDASNPGSCAVITKQLAATIKVSRLHAQVIELSLTDPLTNLYNRRFFDLFLKNEIVRSLRYSNNLSVIMIDLDYFKKYNDQFGHPAGDEALQYLAKCLTNQRRESDVIARLGGEEFVIILPQTGINEALDIAETIRKTVAELNGLKSQITVSLGVSELGNQNIKAEALLDQADKALYEAKKKGRNQVCLYHL